MMHDIEQLRAMLDDEDQYVLRHPDKEPFTSLMKALVNNCKASAVLEQVQSDEELKTRLREILSNQRMDDVHEHIFGKGDKPWCQRCWRNLREGMKERGAALLDF